MAQNKTLELSIKIAGKVDKSLTAAINNTNTLMGSLSTTMSRFGTAGLATMGALATGTVAALATCTREAAKFENYMSDVVKVVDGMADATGKASDQIAENGKTFAENYSLMEETLKDLSTQIPYTYEDLTRLAAAAGQSGKTFDDLTKTDFLKDIAMWGTAMDVSADQAGDWGAKWEQAFKMNHDQVMDLADVINYLGNNYATTAAEIAQSVNQSASMGQIAGVDPAATAAIAASMQAMGVSTDRVGTTISRIYTNISKGANATKAQREMWKELGFTAEGVAKSMQVDGAGTLVSVFEAINQMPEERKIAALNTLFGQWAIEGGAKVTENLSLLTGMLDEISERSIWEGSMEKEFIIKATTPEAIETMLGSAKSALMDDIGSAMLPAYKDVGLAMINLMNTVRDMPELEQLAETLGELASKGVEKLGEAIKTALPYIQKGLDYLVNNGDQVAKTVGAVAAAFVGMKFAPAIESLLGGAGSLLFGSSGSGGKRSGGLFGTGGIVDAAKLGAQMANSSMTRVSGELITNSGPAGFGQKVYNNLVGGTAGILNRKKIYDSGLTNRQFMDNVAKLSGTITKAKVFLPGIAKTLGSGATTMGGAAAVGAGSVLGAIGAVAGIGSGVADIVKGTKQEGKEAKDSYFTGGSKIGMTAAGAGIGAAVGSVVPVVGTAAGALIGAGIGGVASLFVGDDVGQALSDATDEGGALTKPRIEAFFTQNIPNFFNNLWDGISGFFGTTLPTWAGGVWNNSIVPFFTEKVPGFFQNLLTSIGTFFTETVPYAIGYAAGKIQIFFTQDVPIFFQNLWDNLTNFFTQTLPTWASDVWNNSIVPFFTEKVPAFFGNLWDDIGNFFTQKLPEIVSGIWESISGFFTETLPDFFKNTWSSITGSFSAGYSDATVSAEPHAVGGIFTSPHLGLVAEAGPESIIPLSAGMRSRGLNLWMQTGRMLGIETLQNTPAIAELKEVGGGSDDGPGGGFTFAPNIIIQGNADRDVIDEALRQAREQFEAWYEQMVRKRARVSY